MATEPATLTPEDVEAGAAIRALREAHELTQVALAELIGISGPLMNLIENGKRRASIAHRRAIAEALGVPLDAINGTATERVRALADKLGVSVGQLGEAAS